MELAVQALDLLMKIRVVLSTRVRVVIELIPSCNLARKNFYQFACKLASTRRLTDYTGSGASRASATRGASCL